MTWTSSEGGTVYHRGPYSIARDPHTLSRWRIWTYDHPVGPEAGFDVLSEAMRWVNDQVDGLVDEAQRRLSEQTDHRS